MTERVSRIPDQPDEPPALADLVAQRDNLTVRYEAGELTLPEYEAAAGGLGRELDGRRERLPVYERDGETYRALRIRAPDDGPATADFLVRRSDGRFGGYIVDLAADGGEEAFGPEDPRYEAYDDCGRLIDVPPTNSLRGALSHFAKPGLGIRWISDRLPERELEAE